MSTPTTLRPTPVHSSNDLRQATIKKNMSVTQTYYLAHKARGKLSREAAQPDHDLRLLVGHANLLDSLMVELADAEREQERWFNQSVRGAHENKKAAATQQRHIQWADRIVEETEEEEDELDSASYSSDSDEDYDEDIAMYTSPSTLRPVSNSTELMEEEDDLEEDYAQLELVRTPSHSNSPPELVDHDSDSSEDESMPPSPTDAALEISEKEVDPEDSDEEEQDRTSYYGKDYYLPARNPTRLVTAISVY